MLAADRETGSDVSNEDAKRELLPVQPASGQGASETAARLHRQQTPAAEEAEDIVQRQIAASEWGQDEAMGNPDELTWDFDRLARRRFILDSPEDCIDDIRSYEESLKPNLLLLRFDWTPGLEQQDILQAMEMCGAMVLSRV